MAENEKVKGYQRTLKTGQVVTVKSHERMGQDVAVAALADPDRPPIAARGGTFPGGRSIPGVWVKPPETPELSDAGKEAMYQQGVTADAAQAKAEHDQESDAEAQAAGATFTAEHIKKIMGKPVSKKTSKVIKAAAEHVLPDTVYLSAG
jgi:hypothetical protein